MNRIAQRINPRALVVGLLVYAYFVLFPGDLAALTQPLEPIAKAIRVVLEITVAISPWLYTLAGVGAASLTALSITTRILAYRAATQTSAPRPAGDAGESITRATR